MQTHVLQPQQAKGLPLDEVTLAERLKELTEQTDSLREQISDTIRDQLGAADALYLDGTVSRLYAPALNRDDGGTDMGPIVAIVRTPAREAR